MKAALREEHSATVDMQLEVDGHTLRVSQAGPDTLILRDKCEIDPGAAARLIITVDGKQFHYEIVLIQGISSDSDVVKFI
jgi:hypothetical protein